jgi:hypothetical protein
MAGHLQVLPGDDGECPIDVTGRTLGISDVATQQEDKKQGQCGSMSHHRFFLYGLLLIL